MRRLRRLGKNSARWRRALKSNRIATICTRLLLHVTAKEYRPQPSHAANFAEFLLHEAIPNDLRGSLMMDLSRHDSAETRSLIRDNCLTKLLLEKL